MSFNKNKFKARCERCGKELEPGKGFVIKRFKGYEISCGNKCLLTNLRAPACLKIESRIKIPQVTSKEKINPYLRRAEFRLIEKMKEIFNGNHWTVIRNKRFNITSRGTDLDKDEGAYCYVRATIADVKRKNKKEIIIYHND